MDAAKKAETDAALTALQAILTGAKPRLKSISFRPVIYHYSTKEEAEWAGFCITDKDPGPSTSGARDDTSGLYCGKVLFALPDGSFCELTYSGTWSRLGGAQDGFKAVEKFYPDLQGAWEDGWKPSVESVSALLAEAFQRNSSSV